jgi:hypothetical protein
MSARHALPSWKATNNAMVHGCSLSEFCWPAALRVSKDFPNAALAHMLTILRPFIDGPREATGAQSVGQYCTDAVHEIAEPFVV